MRQKRNIFLGKLSPFSKNPGSLSRVSFILLLLVGSVLVQTNLILNAPTGVAQSPNQACVQPPQGIAHWWPLNENSGSTAHDIVGGRDATTQPGLINGGGPISVPGMVGGAFWFDGSSMFAQVQDGPGTLSYGNLGQSFSIDAWINASMGAQGVRPIVDKRVQIGTLISGYAFFLYNGSLGMQLAGSGGYSNYVSTGPNLADGHWHFVAVTVDRSANQLTLYVDNLAPVLTVSGPKQNDNNNAALLIGSGYPIDISKPYFMGAIDEVEIYNRALSQTEVQSIFNAGSAGKCTTTSSATTTTITTWDTERTFSTTTALSESTTTQTVKTQTTVTNTQIQETISTTTWTRETGVPVTYTTTITNSTTSTSCLPGTTECRTLTFTNSTTFTYTVTTYTLTTGTSTIVTLYATTVTGTQSGGATVTQTFTSSSSITIVISSHLTTLTSTGTSTHITTKTTPTTTVTGPANQPTCVIATAAYGSELAGPVQFLRDFRDSEVQKTALGARFMAAFNHWYYSWAPGIAQQIAPNENYKAATRILITPLIGSLYASHMVFAALAPISPELAILSAGLLASAMLGLIYLTPAYALAWKLTKRRMTKRTIYSLVVVAAALTFLATLTTGTFNAAANLTALAVVQTMLLTPALMLRKMTSLRKLRV